MEMEKAAHLGDAKKADGEAEVQITTADPLQYDITPTLSQENEKAGDHEQDTKQ